MDDIRALKVALEDYERCYEYLLKVFSIKDGLTHIRVQNMEHGVCHYLKQRFDHELTPKIGGYICAIPEECDSLDEILDTFTTRIKWIQMQIDKRSIKIEMKPASVLLEDVIKENQFLRAMEQKTAEAIPVLEGKIADRDRSIGIQNNKITSLKKEVENIITLYNLKVGELNEARNEIKSLVQELTDVKADRDLQVKARHNNYESKMDYNKKNQELINENSELRNEIDFLNDRVSKYVNTINGHLATIDKLKKDIEQLSCNSDKKLTFDDWRVGESWIYDRSKDLYFKGDIRTPDEICTLGMLRVKYNRYSDNMS